jgi:PAS domain S-box-containing protein
MLGRTPEEVIGHPRTVFIDEESPELMAILAESADATDARGRLIFKKASGEEFPVYAAWRRFELPSGEQRICTIVRDLSETEMHEAKYREGERLRLV